jgi:hypothetical protein
MKGPMSEEKKTESGAGGLQRSQTTREQEKDILRYERRQIREGHLSGGYCNTEKLLNVEGRLWRLLAEDIEEAKEKHGYSPDPKFKHPEIRKLELERDGLAFRPRLVVAVEKGEK